MRTTTILFVLAGCASSDVRFPLREPFTVDTDLNPVNVACRRDPTKKEPNRVSCMPAEYVSPFAWNQIENTVFEPLSRLLSIDVIGEAANANSLDEVADSSWFQNRIGAHAMTAEQKAAGACKPEDILPTDVPDGAWVIDHGKDNGSTPGFRVDVPGKGKYLLKADDPGVPERASAASVIGAALYHALGFATSCEQIVYIRRAQLRLMPGLKTIDNAGVSHAFDEAALDKVLEKSPRREGALVRMQASKWLPGVALGPFRYEGTREDDPNDIIRHEDRRELRGSKLLAAWLNHWDAREQNTMDLWFANDPKNARSSPGVVRHCILDTSDTLGGEANPKALAMRLGKSYTVDFGDIFVDVLTLGIVERPWERAHYVKGREKFGFFTAENFDPANWKPLYPNPAFLRMTERDGAWMARQIARISREDLTAIVTQGQFADPGDADYLTNVLVERQHIILLRYLTRLSPIADVHREPDGQLCAVDLARLRNVLAPDHFHYEAIEEGGGQRISLPVTIQPEGVLCFMPRAVAAADLRDDAPERRVLFRVTNGAAGPLEIHTYDLGSRGMHVVGLVRPPRTTRRL